MSECEDLFKFLRHRCRIIRQRLSSSQEHQRIFPTETIYYNYNIMVIEDISKATSVVKIRKTVDFFDEKYDLMKDLNQALNSGIELHGCLILNLEENGICCLTHSRKILDFEVVLENQITPSSIRCLTYQGVRTENPDVLFILGGDTNTSRKLYGESFLGSKATFIYSRTAPFSDLLSKNLISKGRGVSRPTTQSLHSR